MNREIGKLYVIRNHKYYQPNVYYYEAKKVVNKGKDGRDLMLPVAVFYRKEDAEEYCRWWNKKHFNRAKEKKIDRDAE